MLRSPEEFSLPDFEIDRRDEYAQYILDQQPDILFYLQLLARQSEPISAYIDDGRQSFLTALLAVDAESGTLFLEPPLSDETRLAARQATTITLIARLEGVKTLFRINAVRETQGNHSTLTAPLPATLLRLQRREFFRLEPPTNPPIHCGIAIEHPASGIQTHVLPVLDISAGGISLQAPTTLANDLEPGGIFQDCRLDIPEECVLQINLQVQKVVEISTNADQHKLRVGCSFVGMPAMRLATIERYITRIERERTARNSGLAD
ncbi:MAG TPA: flagellar regulator YcgR PilZN domain-containing protein [Azonexus sp.]|nr:flagellar regulator YcgR PilZN domain-containing protein [Azonexus sp.]